MQGNTLDFMLEHFIVLIPSWTPSDREAKSNSHGYLAMLIKAKQQNLLIDITFV